MLECPRTKCNQSLKKVPSVSPNLVVFDVETDEQEESSAGYEKGTVVVVLSPLVSEKYITNSSERTLKVVEAYCRALMALGPGTYTCRRVYGRTSKKRYHHEEIDLEGKYGFRLTVDIVKACLKHDPGVLFHSTNRQYELIDFIYKNSDGHVHAFQVTLGESHSANETHIAALEKDCRAKCQSLKLHYLVPGKNFNGFVSDPVAPTVGNVKIHVLIANPDEEQIRSSSGNM